MMIHYLLAWIPMILIGVTNGIIRELTYGKVLPELRAHQLSTLIGIILLGIYVWAIASYYRFSSPQQALWVGMVWLALTIAFEFGFGHYIAHHSWEQLLQDYNLLAGRVWVFVPMWIAIAPILFYHLMKQY